MSFTVSIFNTVLKYFKLRSYFKLNKIGEINGVEIYDKPYAAETLQLFPYYVILIDKNKKITILYYNMKLDI